MNESRPSLDAVFDALASRRRRYVLYYLDEVEAESVLAVEDIAERVARWEREWDGAERGSADERRAVRIDLHHNHLPRLADVGLLDYDARTETVRTWETPAIERWVPSDGEELPRLRSLFGAGDPE